MGVGLDDPMSLKPGTVIGGRYEVVKCLGAGSMGLVYACRHKVLSGHMVAVKVLFAEVAQDEVAVARFRNEIFASYGVSHPNVVRAYEYIPDGDIVAYSMEFVAGGDLANRLAEEEYLPIPEVIQILIQMCQGVQAIHNAGIVHRDLKPENIMLTKEGLVKITDFGIARLDSGPRLTEHGGVVGTIDYVSPEYMLKSQVDNRSDIYAIGILAFEMICGEPPFKGSSVYQTMTKRLKSDPPAPSTLRTECRPELDAIILKAMARNPEERYQSATEMAADLMVLQPGDAHRTGAFQAIGPAPEPVAVQPATVTPSPVATPEPKTSQGRVRLSEDTASEINLPPKEVVEITSLYRTRLSYSSGDDGGTILATPDADFLSAREAANEPVSFTPSSVAPEMAPSPSIHDDGTRAQDHMTRQAQSPIGSGQFVPPASKSSPREVSSSSIDLLKQNWPVVAAIFFGLLVGFIILRVMVPDLFSQVKSPTTVAQKDVNEDVLTCRRAVDSHIGRTTV